MHRTGRDRHLATRPFQPSCQVAWELTETPGGASLVGNRGCPKSVRSTCLSVVLPPVTSKGPATQDCAKEKPTPLMGIDREGAQKWSMVGASYAVDVVHPVSCSLRRPPRVAQNPKVPVWEHGSAPGRLTKNASLGVSNLCAPIAPLLFCFSARKRRVPK